LIAYAALDIVESTEWSTNNMYMKTVDKFNEYNINCMITPGSIFYFLILFGMRFIFIHEGKSEDAIRNFFHESYEYYVKVNLVNIYIL
jgi:hypothetical protein